MNFTVRILFLFAVLTLTACSEKGKKDSNPRNLPPARGEIGEIVLAMDSAQWAGALGKEIRTIFHEPIPGLPQPESMFTLRRVDPMLLNDVLKQTKNLILVTTLDNKSVANRKIRQGFTQASVEQIQKDSSIFMNTSTDQYAKGQQVMFLFGQTEELLLSHLKKNRDNLRHFFNTVERKRIEDKLTTAKTVKGLAKKFEEKYGFTLTIPMGYALAQDTAGFVWLRHVSQDIDKSLFISWKDYTSENVFEKENVIALRDSVTKQYILGDDRPGSYMKIEQRAPVYTKEINFNEQYAVEMRGRWTLNEGFMGGPFIGYALADEKSGRLFYIDGFAYAPGSSKSNIIREIEATLWTFEIKDASKTK